VETPPPPVTVARPILQTVVDFDRFTGFTQAVESVDLRARVRGYLEGIHFEEGTIVAKGQRLFEIDPREYQSNLDLAEAKRQQAEAKARLAAVERDRYRTLAQRDAGSRQDYDRAAADLAVAEAETRAAAADIERAELDLEFTKITAPIEGRIGRGSIDVGNLISPGGGNDPPLATIVSVNPVYVVFNVDERSLLRYLEMARESDQLQRPAGTSIRAARIPIEMGLVNEEGYPHLGLLDFADNRVDPSTGTILIRGVFLNEDGTLRPGLYARVRVPIGEPREVPLVVDRALGTDQGTRFVYVIDDENRAVRRDVRAGRVYGGMRIIEEGLEPGERVVINGIQRIRDGAEVDPQEVEMPEPPGSREALSTKTIQQERLDQLARRIEAAMQHLEIEEDGPEADSEADEIEVSPEEPAAPDGDAPDGGSASPGDAPEPPAAEDREGTL